MCFATRRRALFRNQDDIWNLDVDLRPKLVVFCTFSLSNVLRATTPCTCSTSHALHILTSKCASCHKRVHFSHIATSKGGPNMVWLCILTSKCAWRVRFCISPLASWLCTRRFSEPTFRPSGATKHWKNTVFREFPTFSHTCRFSDLLPFDFLHAWASSWLCLSICPYCRKFSFQTSFDNDRVTILSKEG